MANEQEEQPAEERGSTEGVTDKHGKPVRPSSIDLSETPPPTIQERIARRYNEKLLAMGKAAAERMGRPPGTRDLNWNQLVELWDQRDPEVDEAEVWDRVLDQAAQALADDPTLNRQDVLDEVPIQVAEIVYPNRREVIKSMGGTTYKEWQEASDELEKRASARRAKLGVPDTKEQPLEMPSKGGQGQTRPSAVPETTMPEAVPLPVEMPPAMPPTMPTATPTPMPAPAAAMPSVPGLPPGIPPHLLAMLGG